MKKFGNLFFALCSIFNLIVSRDNTIFIYSWPKHEKQYINLKKVLNNLNVKYEDVSKLDKNNETNLYIIFDALEIQNEDLPKYFINYQTCNLINCTINVNFLENLKKAVAIWDVNWANINKYKMYIFNYYYFPENYEYSDPVILPCLLPTKALNEYREILRYSNMCDSDISSLLPPLFVHSYLSNPKLMLEDGIRGGQSTLALKKTLELSNAKLIGIDLDPNCASVYSNIINAKFINTNDLDFSTHYRNSDLKDQKFDFIFIDTSHEYNHTLQELKQFIPLLSKQSVMAFHDSNVTPLDNFTTYVRLTGTSSSVIGNPRGVAPAIKEFFNISFDENHYAKFNFIYDNENWQIVHYPFCNGLTVLKKIGNI